MAVIEDVLTELRTINQRLSNLEFQVKNLDERFESLPGKFQENKLKSTGHSNSQFEDDSFASSSRDFQQSDNLPRDVALNNLNSGELAGKSKLLI